MKKVIVVLFGALVLPTLALASSGGVHWSYSGAEGPANWGVLAPEFSACAQGREQSPIDLSATVEANLPPLALTYQETPLLVVNNGHAIQANYAAGSSLKVGGKTYQLKQFHFHSPSENTIAGRSFPLEAHLVHADAEGNLAVLAVMFEQGAENSVLEPIWGHMPGMAGADAAVAGVTVNVSELLPQNLDYYAFDGSLTTPPCTEGVKWMVLKQPASISAKQLNKFRQIMGGPNNRPVQPLNERTVLK